MLNGWIKLTQKLTGMLLCVKKDEFTATCKLLTKT